MILTEIGDGRAWEVDGRAQGLVGLGLATPLVYFISISSY